MSRQRNYGNGFAYRLRSDKPVYQASESEIKADLKQLEINPIARKISEGVINETVLPKKRAASMDDFDYVVDGLVKLMTAKPKEVKKKPSAVPEKKTEIPIQSLNTLMAMMPYFSMQTPLLMADPRYLASSYNFPSYPFNTPVQITSTADYHLKLAKYIQIHRSNEERKY